MWLFNFADDAGSGRPRPKPQPEGNEAPKEQVVVADPLAEDDDQASVGEEVHTMLQYLLPWAVSILLHLGIGLLAAFATWIAPGGFEEEEIVIPKAEVKEIIPSEVLTNVTDMEVTATTDTPREIETQEVAKGEPSEMAIDMSDAVPTFGTAAAAAAPDGSVVGTDDAGVGIYGVGSGNAMSVIYVIDASGSLVDTLPFVIAELQSKLTRLQPSQRFGVIFFQRDDFIDVTNGMRPATPQQVEYVRNFIAIESGNITPGGSSNPVRAIERAISQRPELIYILSDNITGSGQYAIEQSALLAKIREAKQRFRAQAKINTIQFLHDDPLKTLKKIAEEHGGRSAFISAKMVGG